VARTNHVQPVLLCLPTINDLMATGQIMCVPPNETHGGHIQFAAPGGGFDDRICWPYGKNIYLPCRFPPLYLCRANVIVAERLFETFTNGLIK